VTLTYVTPSAQLKDSLERSGAFRGTDYQLKIGVLSNAAAVQAALTSGAADVGRLGDFSLVLGQANAKPAWTTADTPVKNILAFRPADLKNYPTLVTVAGPKSGITALSQIKGKKFAFAPGGLLQLQYRLTVARAGLTTADITPVQLDYAAGMSALINGDVDLVVTGLAQAQGLVAQGARIVATPQDVGIPAVEVLTANTRDLKDPAKAAAIADFTRRYLEYSKWLVEDADGVQASYQQVAQQTPEQAQTSYRVGRQIPIPIDDALIAEQQRLADQEQALGIIGSKVDVSLQYDDRNNGVVSEFLASSKFPALVEQALARDSAPAASPAASPAS
jgi:sulfonate transport system substrate-binding protein